MRIVETIDSRSLIADRLEGVVSSHGAWIVKPGPWHVQALHKGQLEARVTCPDTASMRKAWRALGGKRYDI